MRDLIQILIFILIGLVLLWFGYTLYFSPQGIFFGFEKKKKRGRGPRGEGRPGAPQTCPVCSALLSPGELVKSVAFPSFTGKDRLMYISGCTYCLNGDRRRSCPVCGRRLHDDEILVARMFDRPRRSHVHVIGCSYCRLKK
ncbi:MAG: hypothetical protein LBI90_05470 [Treponema sp.]|nr:hypothetical protein [Treponema sp.]